jgi:hypothetical protein
MGRKTSRLAATVACVVLGTAVFAQTPQPFPRPGDPPVQRPAAPRTAPPVQPPGQPPVQQPTPAAAGQAPTEAMLGAPIFPNAQFITSYDAGRGQRYYLFGTNMDFAQIVGYYKTVLKQKGELVYEEPPVHMFDTGRFREETMAFPPSVTVKDYTWGGSQGYLNPRRGAEPARFKTIIQIVPAPSPTPQS